MSAVQDQLQYNHNARYTDVMKASCPMKCIVCRMGARPSPADLYKSSLDVCDLRFLIDDAQFQGGTTFNCHRKSALESWAIRIVHVIIHSGKSSADPNRKMKAEMQNFIWKFFQQWCASQAPRSKRVLCDDLKHLMNLEPILIS